MKKYIVLRRFEEKNLGKLQPYNKLQFFCDNHSTAFIQIRELITEPPTYTGRDKHNKEFTFLPQDDDIQFFVFK